MKLKLSFQKFLLIFTLTVCTFSLIFFINYAQAMSSTSKIQIVSFFGNRDFWEKFTLVIITSLLGFLSGYFLSEKKRRDEAIQLSYVLEQISVLEFKTDIQEKVTIRYGTGYEISDIYVISCDIENTCKKVIKNEVIMFELLHSNVGILDSFFEPTFKDNSMGIEELKVSGLKPGEIKNNYIIRNISPNDKIGFRFITARINQQESVPVLFISNSPDSKVELVPKSYKNENDDNYIIQQFITFYLLFFIVEPLFKYIPFFGDLLTDLIQTIIALSILKYIERFSNRISTLLALLVRKLREP